MKSKLWALVVVVATLGWGSAWSMTPAEAAAAGKSDGQARNPSTKSGINSTTGSNYVPNYNNTSPEAAYFGGGNGNVATPTSAKLAACATSNTPECVAIKLMQNKASTTNPISINPVSPLVQNARNAANSPAGPLGATMTTFVDPPAGGSCAPGSTITGTGTTEETCQSKAVMSDVTCQRPWELQIEPWWSYTCEKSAKTVTPAVCDRTLQVTVDWIPNCELATNVAEVGFGWTYRYRSGSDLYVNGGVVRAKCFPEQTDSVRMTLWGGDVVESTYGSGSSMNPPPNPALLPTGDSMDIPVTVTTPILTPTTGILIMPGSGCTNGNCSYNMFRGPKMYGCPSGGLLSMTVSDYSSSQRYLQSTYDEGRFGDIAYSGAICISPTGTPTTVDWDGNLTCPMGSYYFTSDGLCHAPSGETPVVVGPGSRGRSFSVNFVKPTFVPKATDNWISTCGALEASSTCSIVGESCTDGPGTKSINGADITRACWKQKVNYECVTAGGANACQPLMDEPLCSQNSVDECVARASDGSCTTFKAGYKCTKDMGPPAGVTQTGHGYTTIKDALNESACQTYKNNADCVKRDTTCTDSGSKTFFGFTFTKDCWNFQDTYTCPGAAGTSAECQALVDRSCTLLSDKTRCVNTLPSGTCDVTSYTYQCGTPLSENSTGALCDNTPYCINGVCYERERPSDPDFGKSVATMEAARQIAAYIDEGSMQVFTGSADTCARKLLVNCCKGNGGGGGSGMKNSAFFTALDFGRTFAGSQYVYDVLFTPSMKEFVSNGLEALGNFSMFTSNTFQAYGVTLGWGPSGFQIVSFDPWSFALSIAINIVLTELMSCEQSDQTTAVKKDQGICELIGSYCSSKFLGGCIETTQSYCCFNSKLAKAINIQGKKQLGITLGHAQAPNCRGLTVEEVMQIDMTRIDLSEFLADIVGSALSNSGAKGITTDSITNRNPCRDGAGNVDPSQAGRMECNTLPPPSGSATEGPATSTPPPPPPTGDLMPEISVVFTPAVQEIGKNITRSTSTLNAQSLTFTCTGAQPSSGTIPIGAQVVNFPAIASAEGKTVCQYLAVNGSSTNTVEASYEVTKVHPTISASVAPNPVNTRQAFVVTVTTTNATAGAYTCSGGLGGTGTFAMGTATINMVAPGVAGAANCVFEAQGNGFTATTSVTITFLGQTPTLTVAAAPEPTTVGGTLTITTSTTNATTLDFTCTGSLVTAGLLPASGTRPVGTTALPVVTTVASVGSTTCQFKATSSSGGIEIKTITMTVTTPATSLSAAFSPSSVKVGQAYTLTTNAIGMSSLTYSCVGPKPGSGALPVGANVVNYTAVASEIGTTVCTFTSLNTLTGEPTTTTATITVRSGMPVVSADWSSATVRDGDTVYLATTTTDAASLSYSCPAPMASSGSLPVSPSNKAFVVSSTNVGVTTCTVTATGSGGEQAQIDATLTVKPKLPTVTAAYVPSNVTVGQSYALNTDSNNAVTLTYACTGVGPASGSAALGPQTTNLTASLADVGTRTCVYTAANSIGEMATATATRTVVDIVPTVTAAWTPAMLDADQPTALVTNTTNAQTLTYVCSGSIASSGSLTTGSVTTPFLLNASNVGTATCVLTATSSTGSTATATAVLRVNPVIPTVTASWSPNPGILGGTSTMAVTSTRAVTVAYACTGAHSDGGSLAIPNSNTTVNVDASWVGTTTCTVTATSMTGNTATATAALVVNSIPPTVTASATPNPVRDGQTLTLSATSSDSTSLSYSCTGSVTASGTITTPSGSVGLAMGPSNVGSASCVVTATGPGGTATSTATFTVKPKLPTVTAGFSPTTVNVGSAYQLTTNTTDATSLSYVCSGPMAGSGARPTGSQTTGATANVSDVGTTSCTFNASNSAGETATAVAAVTVNNPVIIPTVSASPTAMTVRIGSSGTINYSTTNAVSASFSCTGSWTRSGSVSVPSGTISVTPGVGTSGTTTCVVTATSATGNTAQSSVDVTIKVPLPTVTASGWFSTFISGLGYLFSFSGTSTGADAGIQVSCTNDVFFSQSYTGPAFSGSPLAWTGGSTRGSIYGPCTATATNSLGETATASFTLRFP